MTLNDFLALFPGASREKPKFMALAEAVLSQAADLIPLIAQLQSGFSFAEAEGVQLDQIAEGIGLKRTDCAWGEETSDETFREYIASKLALWSWDGTNAGVPVMLEKSLPGSTQTDNLDSTVTAVPVASPLTAPAAELFPYPAGVRLIT